MSSHSPIENDEINLSELLITVFKYKLLIILIIMITTVGGIVYSWTVKPVYEGTVLLEIGEVITNGDNSIIKPLENTNDLIQLLSKTYLSSENDAIEFNSLSSTIFVQISYAHNNKQIIQKKLKEISQFVIKRHEDKANFLKKANFIIRPTMISSTINISKTPIKPNNKSLIVVISFFTGLILSLFVISTIEFFNRHRLLKQKNDDSTI
jgi:uncharacterized protein involved in exopolysaccharide biosynthesis